MIKSINDFVTRFGTKISLDQTFVVKKQDRYFLLNENLKKLVSKGFFYAGIYLGKVKDGRFFPSFNLLNMIAQKNANKVTVDKKTEWLFICGRDIFKQGITKATGSTKKNGYTLILNVYGECLGYGRIMRNLNEKREGPLIKNSLDVGDFLRRER